MNMQAVAIQTGTARAAYGRQHGGHLLGANSTPTPAKAKAALLRNAQLSR